SRRDHVLDERAVRTLAIFATTQGAALPRDREASAEGHATFGPARVVLEVVGLEALGGHGPSPQSFLEIRGNPLRRESLKLEHRRVVELPLGNELFDSPRDLLVRD